MKELTARIIEHISCHESSILLCEDGKRISSFSEMHDGRFDMAAANALSRALLIVARQSVKEELGR